MEKLLFKTLGGEAGEFFVMPSINVTFAVYNRFTYKS